ncbi:MAG: hypothetical protein MRY83_08910 [Flavobacteriales bacterium]|nr:hypothetical protein [Flavobacteriales bacterium]
MIKESDKLNLKLQKELEKVGIIYIDEKKDYKIDTWNLKCSWKNEDKIEIIWHKSFTEDVTKDLDDFAEFVVNDNVIGVVEIGNLLNQKLEKSFNEVISEKFKLIASKYTGKK